MGTKISILLTLRFEISEHFWFIVAQGFSKPFFVELAAYGVVGRLWGETKLRKPPARGFVSSGTPAFNETHGGPIWNNFSQRRFLELHGTERLQNKFLEALYINWRGPWWGTILPKTSVVFHSYYIQISQCSPITTNQPIVRSVIWYDHLS